MNNLENNLFNAFEKFNSSTDDYLGVLFLNIFHKYPQPYLIFYDTDNKLITNLAIEGIDIHKDISHKLNDIIFLKNAINASKKDNMLKVFSYSSNEWLIVYLNNDKPFLISCTTGTEIVGEYFIRIFTTDIKESFKYIKKWIKPFEEDVNIEFGITAVNPNNSLYTSWYDYTYKNIDINLNYNDDIPYDKICKLIEDDNKSELILFYGEPGTGKTSLIKHLISKYPGKDFIFIDGALLANVPQQNLMSYFLDNNETIFILEDCEKVLMSRENGYNPVMPILLNLTDGIISDVLGIKILCTFNTALSNIDSALLRKGRLSLKYEFKKLDKEKVRKILNDNSINKDMTLADIYNIDEENDFSKKKTTKIGF